MDTKGCPFGISDKFQIMGANSVSGKGFGSAESHNKGAQGRQTLGVKHLIGPYIGAAGSIELNSGSAIVQIPPLSDDNNEWIVIISNTNTSSPSNVSASFISSNWTFTISGSGSDIVNYIVIYKAIA